MLLIDDDTVSRMLLRESLEERCHRVLLLNEASGAADVAFQEQVDVAVLDEEMPNTRGSDLARQFRANPRLAHIGIILVSGCSREQLVAVGRACGADEVLGKRFVRSYLYPMVLTCCARSRRRAQSQGGAFATDVAGASKNDGE